MVEPPQTGTDIVYMDAVLTPNRSLSKRGFTVAIGGVACVFFLTGLMFWSLGAAPILGFFGLDLLAIWFALRLSFRKQREETRVTVTAQRLTLSHRDSKGREKNAELPSAFARVELDEPASAQSWLRIEHGKSAWVIGRFLTPAERTAFAAALRGALAAAKAERHAV